MATETYSDFTNNFLFHPVRGDLTRAIDAASITQSIKNLVLTNKYERFYQPNIGSNVSQSLFENMDANREQIIKANIEDTIRNYEPRATNVKVRVMPSRDMNSYECSIIYTPDNTVEPVTITVALRRVR